MNDGFDESKDSAWSSAAAAALKTPTSTGKVVKTPTSSSKSKDGPRAYLPHEKAVAWAGQLTTLAWLALCAAAFLAIASTFEVAGLPMVEASVTRTTFAFGAFAIMLSCLLLEVFWMPMPRDPKLPGARAKDATKWAIMSSGFGLLCFFTCQTIILTTCAHFVWLLGEASLFTSMPLPRCLAFAYNIDIFVSSLCIMVTLLFLKLCWYEPKWRRDILEINLVEHSPHFGSVQLFIHAVELPLGILSPLCLKCSPLLAAVKPNLLSLTLGSLVYGLCYICLMATMYIWYDAAIYPFIVDMHAVKPFPLGWLGFWAAISLLIAVCVNGLACLVYV